MSGAIIPSGFWVGCSAKPWHERTGMTSQIDLDNQTIHVARVKGSKDSLHTLDRDEV